MSITTSPFSSPVTSLVCSAVYSSLKLIEVGAAPSAWNSEVKIGDTGTRMWNPFRSAGPLIGASEEVIWRNPLSANGAINWIPARSICASIYLPSSPSTPRYTCS